MTSGNVLHSPVFLDNLPDVTDIRNRHAAPYLLEREQQLLSLLRDPEVTWHDKECPACGPSGRPRHFLLGRLSFFRCQRCNTIYAARAPDQAVLDGLRCELVQPPGVTDDRLQEFTSILNWIRLSSARYERPLIELLDYRFDSHAPGFAEAVINLSNSERHWRHVPLLKDGGRDDAPFADLSRVLSTRPFQAVLIQAEIDRSHSPRRLLQVLRDNLAPGSLVFVSTSCADGLEYEILGAESPSFVALDRLNLFSVQGFRMLSEDVGFRCLEISTPGRLDAAILKSYFNEPTSNDMPFWSSFFREANRDRLQDLQVLLQRSLRSGVMRVVLEV
ncbi:hypothetical protein ACWGPT_04980 [Pseudorhizobium sp. NPDC055634]